MEENIKKLFADAERSTLHSNIVKKLIKIYLKNDFDKFFEYFVHLLKFSLIHFEKNPHVERVLSLVCEFSTSVKSEGENVQRETTTEDDEECDIDPFLVALFEFLLENHEANSKGVRYRICHLVNKLLNSMGEQASIDDDLYRKIYDTMLQRLMDKVPAVRVQAIHALSRLQEPRNKECPVIKAYLYHLCMDPSPDVRRAVLSNIGVTIQTLPAIIDRTRDTVDLVRKQAYTVLGQKVHIRSFTIAQRIRLISDGLNDRSPAVRNCMKKGVLQTWLTLLNGDVLELLRCLDVETSAESAELALNCLFEGVPYPSLMSKFAPLLEANKTIAVGKLKAESAFYWKNLARHFRSESADEYFDALLPDLSVFCEYLRSYIVDESYVEEDPQDTAIHLMEKDFVCQQLLAVTLLFDMTDEVGRKSLASLSRLLFLTSTVSESCVRVLCDILAVLFAPSRRVEELAEIVSEIRTIPASDKGQPRNEVENTPEAAISEEQHRKKKLKMAQISVKINQVRDDLEECIRTLNLDRAQALKETLQELEEQMSRVSLAGSTPRVVVPSSQNVIEDDEVNLRDDPETFSRCLSVICGVLAKSDIENFCSILRSLHDNLVLPCLKSQDLGVRRCAVKALALNCLISREIAQQYQVLFIQISRIDVEEIRLEAVRGLFDIWNLYGLEAFSSTEDQKGTEPETQSENLPESEEPADGKHNLAHVIELLTEMLNFESSEAKTLAAEGLCKLLLTSRIYSAKLLSLLIIMWYNPLTEDDHLLRHMLGVFFPCYASLGGLNQETLNEALIPTLHTIYNAPIRSPLDSIDVDDVINFIVSITSPAIVSQKGNGTGNAHDSLVFSICAEVLAFPMRDYSKSLIRSFSNLVLTPTNFSTLKQVQCLVQKILKKTEEKSLVNVLEKFNASVQNMLQLAPQVKEEPKTDEPESVLNVDDQDESKTSDQSNLQRRKRVLYSTLAESDLLSTSGSEADKTPLKLSKQMVAKINFEEASTDSESELNEKTLVEETTDEDVFESAEDTEIELTLGGHKGQVQIKQESSSSDLFSSQSNCKESNSCTDDEISSTPSSNTNSQFSRGSATSSVESPAADKETRGRSRIRSINPKSSQDTLTDEKNKTGSKTEEIGNSHSSTKSKSSKTSRRKSLRVSLKRLSIGTVRRAAHHDSPVTRSSLTSRSSSAKKTPKPVPTGAKKTPKFSTSHKRKTSVDESPQTSASSNASSVSRNNRTRSVKSSRGTSSSESPAQNLRKSARKM